MPDLRFALRQFAKARGLTAVIVLSLAIGMAANAVVLCWIRRFVREPLQGVPRQNELAVFVSNFGSGGVSLPDLRDLADSQVFAGALVSMPTTACLTVDRHPEWIEAQVVSASYFDVLAVRPLLGRTFLPHEDEKPGGNPVVVISERLWRRRFAADPTIIGRVIDVNRHAFTIVGVVPAAFDGTLPPTLYDLWAPASMIWEVRNQDATSFLTRRTARGWHNLARLQPGVTLEQAGTVVAAHDVQLARAYPNDNRDARHRLVPLSQCPWGPQTVVGPALHLLLAVSLGLQAIVTANVANLLLARAAERQREIAIRLAAGATRRRLMRQFLTESLLLALMGAAVGLVLAFLFVNELFWLLLPHDLTGAPRFTLNLDGTSIGLTLGLALVTGVLFGLAPAWYARRTEVVTALKEGGRGTAGSRAHQRLRRTLVIGEVALAVVLLVSAALCARGLQRARSINIGFNPDHVLISRLQIGMNGYDRATGLPFYRELRRQLAAEPGVAEAALASWFPLGLSGCKGYAVDAEGYQRRPGENPTYEYAIVTPRYFATMQIPLLAGRDFSDADDATAPPVAIVNEYFARRFWPGQEVIGRRFRCGGQWRTIVGVAKAGKYNRVDEEPWSYFYLPYLQGVPDLDLSICVRTYGEPMGFAAALRNVVQRLDPGVEVLRTTPLRAHASLALFVQRLASALLLFLGALALLLAAMGVYAVISYTVAQRRQEFGVRLALGAEPRQLLVGVIRQGIALAALGVVLGLVICLGVTRGLRAFLYGVSPFDPLAFFAVALVLTVTAALACLLPARRAMRVDPLESLRAE